MESLAHLAARFPLPWSAYMRLLSVKDRSAREFYENQAIHGGWSVRELDRQIISLLYDRTGRSGDAAGVPNGGSLNRAEVEVAPKHTVKDPSVLAFLDLDDENSESDLKDVLIRRLETFLLELGRDFSLVSRQQSLRVENERFRVDRLFFHRRLRCLVVVDVKLSVYTDADADRIRRYLDHAREHWMQDGENPPIGLTLCSQRGETVARYALEGLPNEMMTAEYRSTLPDEQLLAQEVARAREALHEREWDRPSLKEVYSIGDWIYLDFRFGRVVAVRDSEMDVDYGHSTSTLRSDADLSNIEKGARAGVRDSGRVIDRSSGFPGLCGRVCRPGRTTRKTQRQAGAADRRARARRLCRRWREVLRGRVSRLPEARVDRRGVRVWQMPEGIRTSRSLALEALMIAPPLMT